MGFRDMMRAAAAAVLLILTVACAPQRAAEDQARAADPERARAAELDRSLRNSGVLVFDSALLGYLEGVSGDITRHRPAGAYVPTIRVLADDRPHAFTYGGGFIYITRGLLDLMRTEAEIAMVLAHEMAHFDLRHIAQVRAARDEAVKIGEAAQREAAADRGDPVDGTVVEIVGALSTIAAFTEFTREKELEADRVGFGYARAAGYDAQALIQALERTPPGSGATAPWLSTHPVTEERIAALQDLVDTASAGGKVGAEAYRARIAAAF